MPREGSRKNHASKAGLGGHVGGVVSQDRTTGLLGNSNSFSSTGFIGGGQIGCDYQFAPGWGAGVEGRAAWASLKNSHPGVVRFPATGVTIPSQFTLGNDFLASATARLGWVFADRWLVFVRGGAACTRERPTLLSRTLRGSPSIPVRPQTGPAGWSAPVRIGHSPRTGRRISNAIITTSV